MASSSEYSRPLLRELWSKRAPPCIISAIICKTERRHPSHFPQVPGPPRCKFASNLSLFTSKTGSAASEGAQLATSFQESRSKLEAQCGLCLLRVALAIAWTRISTRLRCAYLYQHAFKSVRGGPAAGREQLHTDAAADGYVPRAEAKARGDDADKGRLPREVGREAHLQQHSHLRHAARARGRAQVLRQRAAASALRQTRR